MWSECSIHLDSVNKEIGLGAIFCLSYSYMIIANLFHGQKLTQPFLYFQYLSSAISLAFIPWQKSVNGIMQDILIFRRAKGNCSIQGHLDKKVCHEMVQTNLIV